MRRPIIFLDDGGVMNDNRPRQAHWQRLVGEYFAPILGGTPEAWAEANHVIFDPLFPEPVSWQALAEAAPDFQSYQRAYHLAWLGKMCAAVGVAAPPDEQCIELAARASAWITRRVRAAFPGAAEAIRALHDQGFQLHTASGESSAELAGYLEGMGVRDCFGRLYGPDLVDAFKLSPTYYERIFADLGIAPADALIVDDAPLVLQWAADLGALTVLVAASPPAATTTTARIRRLAELPELLAALGT